MVETEGLERNTDLTKVTQKLKEEFQSFSWCCPESRQRSNIQSFQGYIRIKCKGYYDMSHAIGYYDMRIEMGSMQVLSRIRKI